MEEPGLPEETAYAACGQKAVGPELAEWLARVHGTTQRHEEDAQVGRQPGSGWFPREGKSPLGLCPK